MRLESVIKVMGITLIGVVFIAIICIFWGFIPMSTYVDAPNVYKWTYLGHNPFHQAIALFVIYYYTVGKKYDGMKQ